MWSGWPPAGASVLVDIDVRKGTPLVGLSSKVREVLPDGLRIYPPRALDLSRVTLLGATVTLRWTDPYRGLCSLPAVITWADGTDRFTPWRVVVTGDTLYIQRRRYVREQVGGTAVVTPRAVTAGRTGPGNDVVGRIGDLSEGGVRVVVVETPMVRQGRDVRVRMDFDDGGRTVECEGQVVRVDGGHRAWEVVVMFPDPHPAMDRIRSLVFGAQRHRLKSVLGER